MLKLLLGRDWTANRERIFEMLARDVQQRKANRILIVPELISHDTERRLAAAAGDTASRYAQVLSFTRLARRVADTAGTAAPECLDDCGRVVAMAAAARQLHSQLKTYASVETKPDFLEQVLDAVDEFKRCCITTADLQAASAQSDGLFAQKLEELSLLMESYDGLCAQGKRDPRDQMTWVLEQLEEGDFAARHVFYVDGFPDFTRQNMAVLAHILRAGTDMTVSLNCDAAESRDPAFEKAGRTAAELCKLAREAGVEIHIETVEERTDALSNLRKNLFRGRIQSGICADGCLQAVHAASAYAECQVAAQRVMELTQQGARYRDVAVVCAQTESYGPMLERVFEKCRIPLYRAGTESVLDLGAVSTVLFALEAALNGLEQRDVLHYLRSTLSPVSADDCDLLENYALIWRIDRKGWSQDWTMHPQGLQGKWDGQSERELTRLNEVRRAAVEPLSALGAAFDRARNVSDQVQALYKFLRDIDFRRGLETMAQSMEAEGDARGAQIYCQMWEILCNALEQLYDVLGQTQWDNDTFVRLLKLLLSRCNVGTIPPMLDAVSAGGISAMRCQQQKHLILLGANESALPAYGGAKGLLTERERELLRTMGVPLTGGAMDGLQAQYAEIYGVFCGAGESVTVTCSGGQSSAVYQRLAQLCGGEKQADTTLTEHLRRRSAAAAFLVGRGDAACAEKLGLEAEYQRILRRRDHQIGVVERKNVVGLYGKTLRLSASQVDLQAQCRLAYFLKYGLRARERKEAAVDPAEFGTYVHAVLEQTCRAVMERGGFHRVSRDETLALAAEASDAYLREHFAALDSQRTDYLMRRNVRELEMVVRELWRELSQGQYEPACFELHFDDQGQMPAICIPNDAMPAQLRGFVDRVDVWKRENSTYFRVVDYKTGKKSFDYCDVYNGVGLQMLIYLFALEKAGGQILPGERIAAGVQYFPARAPYRSVENALTEQQAQAERLADWKRSGLLLADEASLRAMDPSPNMDLLGCKLGKNGTLDGDVADQRQMALLEKYMMDILGDMVCRIADGWVDANPYTRGTTHDACAYCPYGAVCHSQSVTGRRNYKAMKAEQFWQALGKEETDG